MRKQRHHPRVGRSGGVAARSLLGCAVALAMIAIHPVSVAAQYPPAAARRGQTSAQASGTWRDNCWYVRQGANWQPQDLCRVMISRSVYDTYRPSTKAWLSRIDESDPGWTMTRALNDPNAVWFRYRTSTGTDLQMLVNNQWVDAAAYLKQLAATAPRAQPQLPAYCPPFQGPLMAPNVRESIPVNSACTTPEEKAWQHGQIANTQNQEALRQMKANCEALRASQPYVSSRMGPDRVMLYRLNDGSEHPQGGSLNRGWYWTATGPQRTAC